MRINTIESTSPHTIGDSVDEASLPTALIPSEPESPDKAFSRSETEEGVRAAIVSLPWRERKVVGLYYYNEATMKDIGAEIGVNESRVSQLHARAIRWRSARGASRRRRCRSRGGVPRREPVTRPRPLRGDAARRGGGGAGG